MAVDWKCSGCGMPYPDKMGSCDCATGCLFRMDGDKMLSSTKPRPLDESIRVPLHELQADVDYLIGRVVADASCAPMIAASIKEKLTAIEQALTD